MYRKTAQSLMDSAYLLPKRHLRAIRRSTTVSPLAYILEASRTITTVASNVTKNTSRAQSSVAWKTARCGDKATLRAFSTSSSSFTSSVPPSSAATPKHPLSYWIFKLTRSLVRGFVYLGTRALAFLFLLLRFLAIIYLYSSGFKGDGTDWSIARATGLQNLDPASGKDRTTGKPISTDDDSGLAVDYTKDHQIAASWIPQWWVNLCRNAYSIVVLGAVMLDYAIVNADAEKELEEDNLLNLKVFLTKRERLRVGLPPIPDEDIEARASRALYEKKARHRLARAKAKRKSTRKEKARRAGVNTATTPSELEEEARLDAEAHAALGIVPIPTDPVLRVREMEERLVTYDVHSNAIALIRAVLNQEAALYMDQQSRVSSGITSPSALLSRRELFTQALRSVADKNDVPADLLTAAVSRHRNLLETHQRNAFRLLTLAHEQGGVYVKAAQYITSSAEGVPKQYQRVLSRMQDRAAPLSLDLIRPVFRQEFGKDLEEVFSDFSPRALAAASMAQVHSARLIGGPNDGRKVAVKVQYRHISASLDSDLRVISFLAGLCEKAFPSFVFGGMVDEFGRGIRSELDFANEGRNGERTAALLRHRADACVPAVAWSHSTRRILTTEFINGVKINDPDAMRALGIRPSQVLDTFIGIFGEMMFSSGFLHCDPHPGNAMVRVRKDPNALDTELPWVNEAEKAAEKQLYGTLSSTLPLRPSFFSHLVAMSFSLLSSLARGVAEATLVPALVRQVRNYVLFGNGEAGARAQRLDNLPPGVLPAQYQVVMLDHGLYTELHPKFRQGMSRLFASFLKRDVKAAKAACEDLGMGPYWKILHLVFTGRLPGSNRAARSVRWTKEERMQLLEEFQDFDFSDVTAFISDMSPDLMYFTKTIGTIKSIGTAIGLPDTRQKQLLVTAALWGARQAAIDPNGPLRSVPVPAPYSKKHGANALDGAVLLDLQPLPPLSWKDTIAGSIEQTVFGVAFFLYELFVAKVETNDPQTVKA